MNSNDESFLLNLAFNERLDDLDQAAIAVCRLGGKCSAFGLKRFDLVYADMKLGAISMEKFEFGSKCTNRLIEKMKKFISVTSNLNSALESLAELEQSEKKVERWKNNLDPKQLEKTNFELFNQKLAYQRKQVQCYKKISLWNQTFDKSVGLMSRIVCIIYARLYTVFVPYVADLPEKNFNSILPKHGSENYCFIEDRKFYQKKSKSGPITKSSKKRLVRFPSRLPPNPILPEKMGFADTNGVDRGNSNNRVYRLAQQSTTGARGLSLRYANVIVFAERCLYAPATIGENARRSLYEMLPEKMKATVRRKLKRQWVRKELDELGGESSGLAEGWRNAVEEIMEWLTPMAHDTLKWQSERSLQKQKFDANPTVLLLQTLHYSDLEKTETAIVEVLVGLSCIFRYENARNHLRGFVPSCR